MKITKCKYVLFFTILVSVFFIIYKKSSDNDRLQKLKTSFKEAIIIALILTGLWNDNYVYQQKILNNQNFNSISDNTKKIILAKAESNINVPSRINTPSNFPTPPVGDKPTQSIQAPTFRKPAQVVPKLGGRRNPNDNGGNGNGGNGNGKGNGAGVNWISDDDNICPSKDQSKKPEIPYYQKKKKVSYDQCPLDENITNENETLNDERLPIVDRTNEVPRLEKQAERSARNQEVKRDIKSLINQAAKGNLNPGIGTEHVFKDVYELRGDNGGRVYFRKRQGKIEILAKSAKSNQKKVINILKKIYS